MRPHVLSHTLRCPSRDRALHALADASVPGARWGRDQRAALACSASCAAAVTGDMRFGHVPRRSSLPSFSCMSKNATGIGTGARHPHARAVTHRQARVPRAPTAAAANQGAACAPEAIAAAHAGVALSAHSEPQIWCPAPCYTMQLSQRARVGAAGASRTRCVRVQAKVVRKEGEPRVVRGKCFVTKDVSGPAGRQESLQRCPAAALRPGGF